MTSSQDIRSISDCIRDVPDFPKHGIVFKDITPLLLNPTLFDRAVEIAIAPFVEAGVEKVLGIESRGFLLGVPASRRLDAGLVLARKEGKLPWDTIRVEYDLEYGTDVLEIHSDGIKEGEKVLVVDDVLATGGTARAAADAVEQAGGEVVGFSFLMEIAPLGGRRRLTGYPLTCVLSY